MPVSPVIQASVAARTLTIALLILVLTDSLVPMPLTTTTVIARHRASGLARTATPTYSARPLRLVVDKVLVVVLRVLVTLVSVTAPELTITQEAGALSRPTVSPQTLARTTVSVKTASREELVPATSVTRLHGPPMATITYNARPTVALVTARTVPLALSTAVGCPPVPVPLDTLEPLVLLQYAIAQTARTAAPVV